MLIKKYFTPRIMILHCSTQVHGIVTEYPRCQSLSRVKNQQNKMLPEKHKLRLSICIDDKHAKYLENTGLRISKDLLPAVEESNINALIILFECMVRTEQQSDAIQGLILKLKKHLENTEITINQAVSIFNSLCRVNNLPDGWTDILDKVYEIFIYKSRELHQHVIIKILSKILSKKMDEKNEKFYHPELLDALANELINRRGRTDFSTIEKFLIIFANLKHRNFRFLEYVCDRYLHAVSHNILSLAEKTYLVRIIRRACTSVNYEPLQWLEIKKSINYNKYLREHCTIGVLTNLLKCAVEAEESNAIIEKLMYKMRHNSEVISITQATTILFSLFSMKIVPKGYNYMLNKLYAILVKNCDKLDTYQVQCILSKIDDGLKSKRLAKIYKSILVDALLNELVKRDVDVNTASICLNQILNFQHSNLKFLSFVTDKLLEGKNNDSLSSGQKLQIYQGLMRGYAALRVLPSIWKELDDSVDLASAEKLSFESLCILCLSYGVLGRSRHNLLEKLFSSNHSLEHRSKLLQDFTILWQILKNTPGYNGPWPSEEQMTILNTNIKIRRDNTSPLVSSLTDAFGEAYITSNLRTKLGHLIDHVICFGANHSCVTLENVNSYLEDVNVPTDSVLVLLLFSPKKWYFRNTDHLLGKYSIYIENLQALCSSWRVVTIPEKKWINWPNSEKSKILKDEIFSKLPKRANS